MGVQKVDVAVIELSDKPDKKQENLVLFALLQPEKR